MQRGRASTSRPARTTPRRKPDWTDRVAGGGYFGLGAGFTWSWFSLFARWRVQLTDAADVPETLWLTAVAGVAFELDFGLRIDVSGGWARFTNLASEVDGGAVEAGLSYEFDAFWRLPLRSTQGARGRRLSASAGPCTLQP